MPIKIYTLTEEIKNRILGERYRKRGTEAVAVRCHQCNQVLNIGQTVVSRRSGGQMAVLYHVSCGKRVKLL